MLEEKFGDFETDQRRNLGKGKRHKKNIDYTLQMEEIIDSEESDNESKAKYDSEVSDDEWNPVETEEVEDEELEDQNNEAENMAPDEDGDEQVLLLYHWSKRNYNDFKFVAKEEATNEKINWRRITCTSTFSNNISTNT